MADYVINKTGSLPIVFDIHLNGTKPIEYDASSLPDDAPENTTFVSCPSPVIVDEEGSGLTKVIFQLLNMMDTEHKAGETYQIIHSFKNPCSENGRTTVRINYTLAEGNGDCSSPTVVGAVTIPPSDDNNITGGDVTGEDINIGAGGDINIKG